MSNRNLLIVLGVVLIIGAVAYAMGQRHAESEPQGVLGNLAAGISDKIDQASNQMKADSAESSADSHFDAAKENLGIKSEGSNQ